LRAGASKVSVMNWGSSDLSVTADLGGEAFSGTINGRDELGVTVQGNWNTQLGGHPLTTEELSGVSRTPAVGGMSPLAQASAGTLRGRTMSARESYRSMLDRLNERDRGGFDDFYYRSVKHGVHYLRGRVEAAIAAVVAGELHVRFHARDVDAEKPPIALLGGGPQPLVNPIVLRLVAEHDDLRAANLRVGVARPELALGERHHVLGDEPVHFGIGEEGRRGRVRLE